MKEEKEPSVTQVVSAARADVRPLLWTRLSSFLSLLPLGVWTANHLWDNLAAFRGAEAWERAVTEHSSPVTQVLTWTVVLLPLLIHTVWGVQRLFSSRPNLIRYPYLDNLKYVVQRVAAFGVLLFIGAHLWLALIQPRLVHGRAETFSDLSQHMRFHTPTLIVYILGTLGVCFHLANGISSFAWTWGAMSGRRSFRRFDWLAGIVFVVLLLMAWAALFALWRAGADYPPVEEL